MGHAAGADEQRPERTEDAWLSTGPVHIGWEGSLLSSRRTAVDHGWTVRFSSRGTERSLPALVGCSPRRRSIGSLCSPTPCSVGIAGWFVASGPTRSLAPEDTLSVESAIQGPHAASSYSWMGLPSVSMLMVLSSNNQPSI